MSPPPGLPFAGASVLIRSGAAVLRCPDGAEVALTETERRLIVVLCASAGSVVSRAELVKYLRGPGASPASRSVDQFLRRLRATLAAHGAAPELLRTVHGRGWVLLSA